MPNVTINIKNCGCCPGGIHTPGSGAGTGSQWDDLGDPDSPSGPPDGYSTPEGTLEDRQCKMAVWMYSWLFEGVDMLGGTTTGNTILTTTRLVSGNALLSSLTTVIVGAVTFLMGLVITPGLDPGDAVLSVIAMAITIGIVGAVESLNVELLTQPLFISALSIIENHEDAIICRLSTAANATEARTKLETQFTEIGLSLEQREVIMAFMPNHFFTMLYFTADWWPSFDDDVLSEIATTCCTDYEGGAEIEPFSSQHCQSSNWIVDQLVSIFANAGATLNDSYYDVNPFNDDKVAIYNIIDGNLDIGAKAKGLMTSYPAFVSGLTEIFYSQITVGSALIIDPGAAGLSAYIDANRATLIPGLQAEEDPTDAFTYLYADLSTWIDENVVDTEHQTWMKQSLAAIITPKATPDFMDLLFIQDVDLLGYPSADCGSAGEARLTILRDRGILYSPNTISSNFDSEVGYASLHRFAVGGNVDGDLCFTVATFDTNGFNTGGAANVSIKYYGSVAPGYSVLDDGFGYTTYVVPNDETLASILVGYTVFDIDLATDISTYSGSMSITDC